MSPSEPTSKPIVPANASTGTAEPWSESMDRNSRVRPAWRKLVASLQSWTAEQRSELSQSASRLLEDLGATYNVYNDVAQHPRPRRTDPLPLLIDAAEWRTLSEGIRQRARLLETLLADLYGPQKLLKEGLIPPDLIHSNPHFLAQIRGILPTHVRFLQGSGVDLMRNAQGQWTVLRDHTRAPGGLGQTLENRSLTASLLPSEFEDCRVANLTPFFDQEREILRALAPERIRMPNVVLLTPGFRHPSYFEHAYKARILGIPLVEPGDLTVRERRLFLKTLSGLRRIDVVACRLDDDAIDPLEFWTHGGNGVPGLTEAWRSGNVALANAPGSGFAESPALLPFLRGICRKWLNEDLKLPFVETWWLGQAKIRQHVLSNLRNYVIHSATLGRPPIRASQLPPEELTRLAATLEASPYAFVAQREIPPSLAPCLDEGHLRSQPIVWRAFCQQSASGCNVLPGGLGIISPHGILPNEAASSAEVSKDVWIVESAPTPAAEVVTLAPPSRTRDPLASEVPSRIAEQLFWVGRGAERLELKTRLLRTTLRRLGGEPSPTTRAQRDACFALLRGMEMIEDSGPVAGRLAVITLSRLIHDSRHPAALPSLIRSLLWNAASTRDRLSDDTWRVFNRLETLLQLSSSTPNVGSLLQILDSLILHLSAFSGMQAENMTRGHGWRFLELGRRIERALGVLSLLNATPHEEGEDPTLEPLLETCDSAMTYRRRHFSRPQWDGLSALLLHDPTNPRGVLAQSRILAQQCEELPGDPSFGLLPKIREHVSQLVSFSSDPTILPSPDSIATQAQAFEDLSDLLTQHYFSHSVRRVY